MEAQDLPLERKGHPPPGVCEPAEEILPVGQEHPYRHGPETLQQVQHGAEEIRIDKAVPAEEYQGFHFREDGEKQTVESEEETVNAKRQDASAYT